MSVGRSGRRGPDQQTLGKRSGRTSLGTSRNFSGKKSCAVGAPPSMKMGFSGLVPRDGSVCGTSNAGWRLLGGRKARVRTSIPSVRLTRAGKGTTFCRTHKLGRTNSSVCNRPAAQQSPPFRRCHANLGRTWLWIRRTSGHDHSLSVGGVEERPSSQEHANLWYHYAKPWPRRKWTGII